MTYQFKHPIDTSKFAPVGSSRLNVDGTFSLELVDIEAGVSQKGNKSLDYSFKVIDGPHKNQRHIESFYVFQDDKEKREIAARFMCEVIRSLNQGNDLVTEGPDLIGKRCIVTRVQDGEYQGRPNYKSINWRPYDVPQSASAGAGTSRPAQSSETIDPMQKLANDAADDLEAEDVDW